MDKEAKEKEQIRWLPSSGMQGGLVGQANDCLHVCRTKHPSIIVADVLQLQEGQETLCAPAMDGIGECAEVQPITGQPGRIGSHLNGFTRTDLVTTIPKAHIPYRIFFLFSISELDIHFIRLAPPRNLLNIFLPLIDVREMKMFMPTPTGNAMAECG